MGTPVGLGSGDDVVVASEVVDDEERGLREPLVVDDQVARDQVGELQARQLADEVKAEVQLCQRSPGADHALVVGDFLRANASVLWPSRAPILPSVGQFRYAFAHTLPREEVEAIYERFVVPESRLVGRGPTSTEAAIDFERPRPPLLLVASEDDHIIPASLVRKTYGAYADNPSVIDLHACEGRVHWIVGQEGWEEVADDVLAWLDPHLPHASTR